MQAMLLQTQKRLACGGQPSAPLIALPQFLGKLSYGQSRIADRTHQLTTLEGGQDLVWRWRRRRNNQYDALCVRSSPNSNPGRFRDWMYMVAKSLCILGLCQPCLASNLRGNIVGTIVGTPVSHGKLDH